MALSWSMTVFITALLALVCSMCIYTEFEFTVKVPVKTTAENAFRFLSNPMVIKEIHPLVVSLHINSQREITEPPGEYFDMAITENIPVLGHHVFRNQVWTNQEALTIKNLGHPLWGIMTTNVTWTVFSEGDPDTESCYIEERAVTSLPWIMNFKIKSIQEKAHMDLLQKAQRTIERLSSTPGRKPGSAHEDRPL